MANEKRLIYASPDDCIKKTRRKTNFAKIIVSGTADKPYYEIMWFNYMDGQYHIGYSSYNLHFVFQWLSECFEIEEATTVDAVEVVHGRWKRAKYTEAPLYICSECDKPEYKEHRYCPNCGAKMDGGNDNERS